MTAIPLDDIVKDSYNKFSQLPLLPYNMIAYLMQRSELIWRLLKYNDADAWLENSTHPNLTESQKALLIYDGKKRQTDCRIFCTTGLSSGWSEQVCQLRISVLEAIPTNKIYGAVTIGIEVYPHDLINTLSNYQTRADTIAQQLIEVFSGAEVGGLGRLFFDASQNSRTKISVIGSSPYVGKGITLTNYVV
jgi:hypothetical protein